MSDHLPECFLATACKHEYYDEPPVQCANCGKECICDRLRACEARVISTGAGAAADIEFGRQEGLREARDAVDVALLGTLQSTRDRALAAIDALKGENA